MKNQEINFKSLNLVMFLIGLFFLILYLSAEVPFLPAAGTESFFRYILPAIIFLGLVVLYLIPRKGITPFQRLYRGTNALRERGSRAVILAVLAMAAFAWMLGDSSSVFLAYPTKYLAKSNSSLIGFVKDSYPYMFSRLRGYNDIDLDVLRERRKANFMWPSNRSKIIQVGKCVTVTGRSWVFGMFIEDVVETKCPT